MPYGESTADELLTTEEAAQVAAVSVSTIRAWAADGRLISRRTLGGHRRFRRGDVEATLS